MGSTSSPVTDLATDIARKGKILIKVDFDWMLQQGPEIARRTDRVEVLPLAPLAPYTTKTLTKQASAGPTVWSPFKL